MQRKGILGKFQEFLKCINYNFPLSPVQLDLQ